MNSKNTSSLNIKILIVSGIRRTTTQLLLIIIFGYILVIYGNDHKIGRASCRERV